MHLIKILKAYIQSEQSNSSNSSIQSQETLHIATSPSSRTTQDSDYSDYPRLRVNRALRLSIVWVTRALPLLKICVLRALW